MKAIIIWRNIEYHDLKRDKEFIEIEIIKDVHYDKIYVNGNGCIKNTILIDEKLEKLMG